MTTELTAPTAPTALALLPSREQLESTASEMARTFQEATAEIDRLMKAVKANTDRLATAFLSAEDHHDPFRIEVSYNGYRYYRCEELKDVFAEMKRCSWRILFNKLGIKNIMSVADRKKFEDQLEKGELPDITEESILGILNGLAGQAKDFARVAAVEVFDILRPQGSAHSGTYKTNDKYRVGRKVILSWYVERCYNAKQFRVNYHCEQQLTALDGVFHLLDGKGVMREHRGPLVNAINDSPDGRGETEYFKFKCFKNRNLHLEMKRLDLVQELNFQAAGERVLGEDAA